MLSESAGLEAGAGSSADLARHLKLLRNDLLRRCRSQKGTAPASSSCSNTGSHFGGAVNLSHSLRSGLGRPMAKPAQQNVRVSQQRQAQSLPYNGEPSAAATFRSAGPSEGGRDDARTRAFSRSISPTDTTDSACGSRTLLGVAEDGKKQTHCRSPGSRRSSHSPCPSVPEARPVRGSTATAARNSKKGAAETNESAQMRALNQKLQGITAKYSNLVRLASSYKAKAKETGEQLDEAKRASAKLTEELAAAESRLDELRESTVSKAEYNEVKGLLLEAREEVKTRDAEIDSLKKQLHAEQQEKVKLRDALTAKPSRSEQANRAGKRDAAGNHEEVDPAAQRQESTAFTDVVCELEKLRSSAKAKDQRGRQLQEEVSQLRERLAAQRRTTEKAQHQLACFMQRMDALRRHRAQTEARAGRQAQVLAALRSELTSEHENRQVLLQILELYAPEVVTELRQRMQKPPPSTFPSLCLDSCGSGAPGALSEKFGSPSSAASPRAALTGRRSPFKAESLCRAPLRHAAHAGLDPREAHSRPFAAKESPGVPQVSAAHASQLNVATGSVAPCPTESPDASPTDRLRLLRRRGLLCGFAYGALNSECLPGGDASAPTPLEAGSGGSASSAAPAPDTARVREVPWNGSAAAPQWRPPPSNAEAPSRSPHMEAWAGGQTIPRSSLGTPCVACRPPPHRAAACHANCGCSAQSPLVSRELVSRGEPVIGRDAEGTPAAACQQEMENRESLKSRGNACNAPEVDGMTYMHARRPPREASRASCDGLAFIKPMSPPTPHCEPVARLALFEELERCCAPDGLAAVSQPLPRQCFPVEGRHGDAAPLEPNGCDAIRLTGDLESPSMINRGLRLLPAEPPLPPAEPEEEQTNTRGYLQASPERKTSKPPLFRNEDLSSKPRRLVQAATPLVGGGMQSPHTLSPAAPVAAGNRAMDGRALYRQGYTAGLPLQSCEAEVSLPSVRVRGTARKSAACGLDAEVAAPDADRGCQGDDAGALMQGTFGLKTKEKEASGVSRSEAQQVWLENPNLALGAARTCSSPPIASSRQGLSSLETSRQDGTPSINVRRGAPFAEELRVAERAAMREPVSGTPCGAKAEKGGREAVDETPVAGNKLGVSKLEPHGLSSTPLTRSPSAAPSVTSAALPFAESSQTSPPPCNPLSRSPEADSVDIGLSEDSQSASPLLLEARAANSSSSPLTQNWAELTRNSDEPGWSRQIEVASRGFRLSDLNEGRRCSDGQKGSNTSPDLRQRVRAGAARTIQKRWRLYKARKMVSSSVSQSCLAACASLLHDRGSPPVSRPANDRALLKCRTLEPRRCHSGWTGQSPEMTPNPIPPPEGKSPVTPQRQTESLRAPDSSPTTHQRGDEQYRALTLVSAKPEPSNQNARNPDATECNTLPFREVATRPQKERPLPPLPPGDMALALQEAKLRRQIRYYAEMHQFYSMQLQQNILDPSDGLEESFDRESFPRMLEGTDLNPLQMDINELLEHSAAFLGDAEPLRQ